MKTAEFGQPCAAVPEPGRCRICGCTEAKACLVEVAGVGQPVACAWADLTKTLCDNPKCVAEAKREIGVVE